MEIKSERLVRLSAVVDRVGLGKSRIYEMAGEGAFPKPVILGSTRASRWVESEIDAWIANQIRSAREAA